MVREKLALACRILGTEGHDDMDLGHLSVRSPDNPDRMIIKGKGLCLSEIQPDDLVTDRKSVVYGNNLYIGGRRLI